MSEQEEINKLLLDYFEGDHEKVWLWMNTRNSNLGGASPQALIDSNRAHKLLAFIKASLEGNFP